ncbi:MAG: PD40 domain-containing protein [Anaerolineae bacterium]|nr:PD40 domain-containing protein [Anaerolineae bacterium]
MRFKTTLALGATILVLLALVVLSPLTPAPTASAQTNPTPTPPPTLDIDDALTEPFGDFLVVRYDPATKTLIIEPLDPSLRIVIKNQVGGAANTSAAPASAANAPATPTAAASPIPLDPASLRGKIIFKSTRDGGSYPSEFLYYLMDPDGGNVRQLDTQQAKDLLNTIQGLEGFSPDRTRVVMGDRACGTYTENECDLYILDVALHASMIFSDEEPSQGLWFHQNNVKAKDPAWSPNGNYIVFASNHEVPEGCRKTMNLFKGEPTQHATFRRLTSYCAGADSGRPSFSPDGSEVVYWTQFPGPHRDIYTIPVGADDTFDWRDITPKRITFEGDNWDPIWIK